MLLLHYMCSCCCHLSPASTPPQAAPKTASTPPQAVQPNLQATGQGAPEVCVQEAVPGQDSQEAVQDQNTLAVSLTNKECNTFSGATTWATFSIACCCTTMMPLTALRKTWEPSYNSETGVRRRCENLFIYPQPSMLLSSLGWMPLHSSPAA